jgi:hypothetical protein
MEHMGPYLQSFLPFAQKRLGFNKPPSIFFDSDAENSKKVLGKTGYYDPDASEIVIFVDNRHPKDILRSLSHELVHHAQNCRGDLNPEVAGETGLGYAQNNAHMRGMESEAYEKGNLCMRDWEDSVKLQLQETNYVHTKGENHKMAAYDELKERITKSVVQQLLEKVKNPGKYAGGEKQSAGVDDDGDGVPNGADEDPNDGSVQEGENKVFAKNHYCAHHVAERLTGKKGKVVDHNWNTTLEEVTAYDVDFGEGDVRTLKVAELFILEASLAEGHQGHSAKRDDEDEEDEQLDERKKRNEPRNDRGIPQRLKEDEEEAIDTLEEEEEIEERKKRDTPRDSDRLEPQKLKVSEAEAQPTSLYARNPEREKAKKEKEEKEAAELQRTKAAGGKARQRARDRGERRGVGIGGVTAEEKNHTLDEWYQNELYQKLINRWTK